MYLLEVFQEPQGLPPKREVEHEIQLLPESPLPNIGLYRKSIIKEDEVKKQLQQFFGAGSHQTQYITMWLSHHHGAKEIWKLENVH
jgi:hypothetical protein